MILPNFKDFPADGRILGIDWGARRTGVAISDKTRQMVFVRPVILCDKKTKSVAKQIFDLVSVEKISGIVFGLPLRIDGSESDTTKQVRACVNELTQYTDIPICFLDESFTSFVAQESMGRVKITDIKKNLDSESARIILENAIAIISRL